MKKIPEFISIVGTNCLFLTFSFHLLLATGRMRNSAAAVELRKHDQDAASRNAVSITTFKTNTYHFNWKTFPWPPWNFYSIKINYFICLYRVVFLRDLGSSDFLGKAKEEEESGEYNFCLVLYKYHGFITCCACVSSYSIPNGQIQKIKGLQLLLRHLCLYPMLSEKFSSQLEQIAEPV